jgi:hypothetical protein
MKLNQLKTHFTFAGSEASNAYATKHKTAPAHNNNEKNYVIS